MLNKINISPQKKNLIVYIVLTVVTLAVFWQVNHYDFINIDDDVYVTENLHVQSGITLEGFRWAFSTTYAEFWHPLTWLSLMLDYQLYGLNAGGYHLTNLILHILSALLLFWLFNRMTGMIWRSAFVAALFALHPLHVESVAWIAERKDVLSAFFFMLTLCLYVYYTEKPDIKKYLLVLICFACGLMSKPMVVTLPIILILLDYWPLKRFESKKDNLVLWQLKEKIPFFVLSVVFSIITLYAQYNPFAKKIPLDSRITEAVVSFVTYLGKTFWPHALAVCYSFLDQLSLWQILGSILLILIISTAVIVMVKRSPYFLVGWLWYAVTLLPVIGIIHVRAEKYAVADRYTYLPLIGIGIMLAWGVPLLFQREDIRKKILFSAGIAVLTILTVLTWQQCGYWKNSITLINHTLQVTENNYLAYHIRGVTYANLGQHQLAVEDFNKAIGLNPGYRKAYNNRGVAYEKLGDYQHAIEDYNKAIHLQPGFVLAYYNRGGAYAKLGQFQLAIEDFTNAIRLNPYYAEAYKNRGIVYLLQGKNKMGCFDVQKACELGNCKILEVVKERGYCR